LSYFTYVYIASLDIMVQRKKAVVLITLLSKMLQKEVEMKGTLTLQLSRYIVEIVIIFTANQYCERIGGEECNAKHLSKEEK